MEITSQRYGNEYFITVGDKEITTTWTEKESEVNEWVSQVKKLHGKKNKKPLLVGLSADRSINYSNGTLLYGCKGSLKDYPYELLQVCVGNQCLLWQIKMHFWYDHRKGFLVTEQPKALKDLMNDSRTTVVGVGIKDTVKKLERETDLRMPKTVELRDFVEQVRDECAKYDVGKLAKVVLGKQMEVVRPKSLSWWAGIRGYYHGKCCDRLLSDELVKYASVEVFLAAEMGSKLLRDKKY